MKDSLSIAVIVAVAAAVVFRLYKKYYSKEKGPQTGVKRKSSSVLSSKEDDYEPYSKK